ncbi:peptidoglycan bridge formation glycyltransferase FemA/FemB family protein [Patescibacteria group bacterium]|nr:peptidoglycan bridge formation glycyltransferase FemA/FemB family protein [Patescibacteria group bacterium]
MEIKEIENKEIWESFLLKCQEKTFLDSWNWGEFNKMMRNKIWRLGILEDGELFSVALVIKIQARRGTFLFLPHGPVFKQQTTNNKQQVLKIFLEKLKEIAMEENAGFIRIGPIWERTEENIEIFKNLGFRDAPIHIHPELTWELDITLPENELLMQMRKTTRYLIRQAQKKFGVKIEQRNDIKSVEVLNNLYQETSIRHHFVPFSFEYLKNEFLAFQPDNQILVLLGEYKGEIVSSAIIIFWQKIAFYHHGASSLKYPKIPTSYFLQWEAIKEAKKKGCRLYNFWGIADTKSKIEKHPWAGLTLFKMGFGGYKKEYVKTQDFPISKKYWLTFVFEKLRKTKRGL